MPVHKIALAAGGTGGHLFPALALAEEIRSQGDTPPRVVFFAADRALDRQILSVPEKSWGTDFRCVYLSGSAFGGVALWRKLVSMVQMMNAILSAWWHLRGGCACVVAFGGYASVPAAVAARIRGIPVYIHEQNSIPGRANRLLAGLASKIFLTFEEARTHFGKRANRCVVTGCPVRKKIIAESETPSKSRMRMLVVGGSQGSKFFLDFFAGRPEFFAWLLERTDVLFLAGTKLTELPAAKRLSDNAKQLRASFTLLPFLERMGPAIRSADILLSRAGASFLAELVSVGKARTILVPFPHALDNHQEANAKAVAAAKHSLADIRILSESNQAEIEQAIHSFIVAGPVPPPDSFSDLHTSAACRMIEHWTPDSRV